MPVHIDQVEAEVEVQSGTPAAGASEAQDEAQALERWREAARREQQRTARTAAYDFDD